MKASGFSHLIEDKFNQNKDQLFIWFDECTTNLQVHETGVYVYQNFNVFTNTSACVMHSPTRGADIYVRTYEQSSMMMPETKQHFADAVASGAPTQSKFELTEKDITLDTLNQSVSALKTDCVTKDLDLPWVGISPGSVITDTCLGTDLVTLDACESQYSVLNPLQYEGCFNAHKVIHCSTVLCILPGPLERMEAVRSD